MLGCGDHKLAVEYAFGLMGMESGEPLSGVRRAVEWLCLRKPWKHHDTAMTGAEYLKTRLSSVQFSCSVVSDSLQPHEPQHARPPCPSPTPRVHPNPCLKHVSGCSFHF